jgi:thiol-disulfide isomerase/thioredoxin/uncharacterized membrane protein
VYLTRFHDIEVYGDQSATLSNCPTNETTNCEVVNTSGYSEFLGVPISALGIPTYLLLLFLAVRGWRLRRLLSYAFAIGLLTIVYSVYLYYVSTVKIGFLCAWCFRLYCINASIPVLAALAAGCNPLLHVREVLGDLRSPTGERIRLAVAFGSLLIITVAGERAFRNFLVGRPPASSTTPAVSAAAATSGATPVPALATPQAAAMAPFRAASPLKEFAEQGGKVQLKPFDLNEHLGKGEPVALIFWEPAIRVSQEGLIEFSRFLKAEAPRIQAYAVVGAGAEERPEVQWESYCLMGVPAGMPLLRDENFTLAKQLQLISFPFLVVFDGKGVLLSSQIQGLKQAALAPGAPTAEEFIRGVARGESPMQFARMAAYYPSREMFGHCAPSFRLPELFSGKNTEFTARSKNGKATLLMFWSATCKHCQKEIPQLLDYVKSRPPEFNMVSVAMIRSDSAEGMSHRKITEAYVKTNAIPWLVLDDSSNYASTLYKITSTPTTFLISPAGEIVGAWYHPHDNLQTAIGSVITQVTAHTAACTPQPAEQDIRASFSVADGEGQKVSLESLAQKPSILHFWATWCAPCQAELPKLLKFRDALNRKGGQLILVSVEDQDAAEKVKKYGSAMTSGFQSYLAPNGGLADKLDMSYSVPRTYLLAGGGEVLQTYRGALPWEDPAFDRSVLTYLQLGP